MGRRGSTTAVENKGSVVRRDSRRAWLAGSATAPLLLALSFSGAEAAGPPANTLPTGGVITTGIGSISTDTTTTTMTVSGSGSTVNINWASFDIGSSATVNFPLTSATSVAINRITGSAVPSQLFGSVNSNGVVFLSNPNGSVFGPTAQINVGSLLGTTLDITPVSGNQYTLSLNAGARGSVLNQGTLQAAGGGTVSLVGGAVSNQGYVVAQGGRLNLIGADHAALSFDAQGRTAITIDGALNGNIGGGSTAAISNLGTLQADGGTIVVAATAASGLFSQLVTNTGLIQAKSIAAGSSGTIQLSATGGGLNVGGSIDATGVEGGTVSLFSDAGVTASAMIKAGGVNSGGNISVSGATIGFTGTGLVDAGATGTLSLTSSGAITQDSGSSINTGTLTGSAIGAVFLTGTNTIGTLGSFSSNGFSLTNQGALSVNGAANAGTGALALTVSGPGALTVNSTGSLAGSSIALQAGASGITLSAGSAVNTGTGALTLAANGGSTTANGTITAATTTVTSGGLLVGDAAAASAAQINGAVQMQTGTSLGGFGTVGSATIANGVNLFGGNASTGTLTVNGNLTLSNGSGLRYQLGASGASSAAPGIGSLIAVTNNLVLNGTLQLSSSVGGTGVGYYRLMTYGGALSGGGLTLGTLPGGWNAPDVSVDTSRSGFVDLLVATAPGNLQSWQGGTGVWGSGNANWLNVSSTVPSRWGSANAVFASGGGTVTVQGSQTFDSLQFVTNGYSLVGANGGALVTGANGGELRVLAGVTASVGVPITGTGGISKTQDGTLILSGANTYMGGTTISAGVLALTGLGTLGNTANSTVVNGATAVLDLGGTAQTQTGGVTLQNGGAIRNGTLTGTVTSAGGVIDTFGGAASVTVTGGTTHASGTNSYTGTTTVNGGTLSVDGSIAASTLTTVNTGGTLGGNGTVGTTMINGGTLSPGNSIGTLTVQGDLSFTAASTYRVEVNPANADRTNVTGIATLGGATVAAIYAPGSYVTKQYTIVNAAGGRTGTFNTLVNTNLPANFTPTLSYDANTAYLNLTLNFTPPPPPTGPNFGSGLSVNQSHVANALVGSFNAAGGIPLAFGGLSPQGLTLASGEAATGTQQVTFDAMSSFMAAMLDPFAAGRDGGGAGAVPYAEETASGYASAQRGRTSNERAAYAAMLTKAPPPALSAPHWSVWASGFGGSQTTQGNLATGSADTAARIYGAVAGADYQISPDTRIGFALSGAGTNYTLAGGLGGGMSDLFQAGLYGRHQIGAAYLAATLAYGWQDITIDRAVLADRYRTRFDANALSGRIEGGYRVAWQGLGLTPYAASQFATLFLPGASEQVVAGSNLFALSYTAKDITAARSELGLRTDTSFALADAQLTLRGQAAWAHNFNADRSVQAAFQALPVSGFVVNGATPAPDAALLSAGAELGWRNGFVLAGSFTGEFSRNVESYAGKATIRYRW